jgi:hypothetical protein
VSEDVTTDGVASVTVPFAMVPEWVIDVEQGGFSDGAVRLYGLLHRYGNSPGGQRVPGRKTLARRMGCSLDTLDRAKQELVDGRALIVSKRHGTTNLYVLETGGQPRGGRTDAGSRKVAATRSRTDAAGGSRTDAAQQRALLTDSSDSLRESGGDASQPGQAYVGFFVDESRRVTGADPLEPAKKQLGKHTVELAKQGVSDETIRAAITEVVEAGLMVGSVLAAADQIHRGGFRGHTRPQIGLSAADIAAMAMSEEAAGL